MIRKRAPLIEGIAESDFGNEALPYRHLRRASSGSLAMLAAMRRALSRL